VIDISEPSSPIEIGALQTSGDASTLAVEGELVFLIAGYALRIVDISDPKAPLEIGLLYADAPVKDVAVADGFAYVVDLFYPGTLRAVDVSDPTAPIEVGRFDAASDVSIVPWGDYSVVVMGDFAYFGSSRLHVIDISDPTNLVEAGEFHLAFLAFALDLEAADGRVYVSLQWNDYPQDDTGLRIIEFGPEYAPTLDVVIDIVPGSNAAPINPRRRGVIPVAIISSDNFDATDVDRTTLAFGPDGAAPAHPQGGHPRDVDGDGLMDLVSHFWIQDSGIMSGESQACVSGKTLEGAAFEGCDAIRSQP
jgi:hypothetical protein